ncbi:hypothetical protein AAFC00_005224 [Neodothiora populina]|uniref:F-box domain-containing protein n=1 Tax=Neodothiora populina TaxID=2781224 RepID=A0ABR3PKK0_9PEZI
MAGEGSNKRRSVRQAVTRKHKRSKYVDPDTDDDFAFSDDAESSTGDHVDGAEHVDTEALDEQPARKRVRQSANSRRRQQPLQRETRSEAARKTASAGSGRPPRNAPGRKSNSKHAPKDNAPIAPTIPSDGIIPKWQQLPYEILQQIFEYAFAAELEIEEGAPASRRAHHPNTWIMRTSRKVCHAFAEPALTAYYHSPALLAHRWLEELCALVKQPDDRVGFRYKMKVKSLKVPVRHLESPRERDVKHVITELVSHLPQLTEFIISHPQDEPPFWLQARTTRWRYSDALFDALDQAGIHLESWRWNWHCMAESVNSQPWHESSFGENIHTVHTRPSFQNLRHLEISHLPSVPPFPELIEEQEDPAGVILGRAICALPSLVSLSFESCDCLTDQLLQGLPENLERLKFVNCATLSSDMLHGCLSRNGSSTLRELILNYNPFMDLAFLRDLRMLCPKLEILKMDLFDYRENQYRHFAEPKYEQLLLEDEVPAWPTTLRTLELVHLSKWGAGSAQNLFRSLVESADSLSDLRNLVLQAHINIPWRDRAAFRDQWIERLQRVYLRQSADPDPRLASLKSWRLWKESQQPVKAVSPIQHGRALSQVSITPVKPGSMNTHEEDQASQTEGETKRRSKRISDQQMILESMPPPEEPKPEMPKSKGRRAKGRRKSDAISVKSGENDLEGSEWRATPEKSVQGLCDVVDIRIDNQRPKDQQLRESDFIDSEASGDEDWTEGAEVEDVRYAW